MRGEPTPGWSQKVKGCFRAEVETMEDLPAEGRGFQKAQESGSWAGGNGSRVGMCGAILGTGVMRDNWEPR